MAKSEKTKVTKKQAVSSDQPIVIQQITIGQLERGKQTIQTWYNNLKAAERVLNPNRRFLLNTYLDIDIDLHLDAVKNKRIRALKTSKINWNGLTNEMILENLQSPWMFELMRLIGESWFWGHTVVEFKNGEDGLIADALLIPPQNVRPELGVITKTMWGSPEEGFKYREGVYPQHIIEIGRPNDLGLYAKLAPYVLLKRDNMSDNARFNEMFGMPLRWYEYDPHDATARSQVTAQAEAHGSAAYVVVPKGTVVNFHEANKSGAATTYGDFHRILNDEISIGVLGQTLTTSTEGKGSNALGKVHKEVEDELAMEDRIFAEFVINHKLKNQILIPRGYPLRDVKASFAESEELDTTKKVDVWVKLKQEGLPIAEEDFYNEFGIPEPGGRPVLVSPAPPVAVVEDPAPPPPKTKALADGIEQGQESLGQKVSKLYATSCKHRHQPNALRLSYESDLQQVIEQVIAKLFNKELAANTLDPALYELITKELQSGVTLGYPDGSTTVADKEMLAALTRDVQVFSAFKTHQFLEQATAALVDETGTMRTFTAFREEVLKINQQYNIDFLRTEYNHAVGSSRMASKWVQIVKNKETLPLLEYLTAGDSRVRQSHQPLNHIILPADHPFWDTYMPPNDWNCRCNVRQLADGEQTIIQDDKLPVLKEEFKFNPGKQKAIFPKNHPYYEVSQQSKDAAANNFGV